ncbi:uncharacterized protein (TIGR02246 family) [Prauserella shujinwangii]|uniref:Uncharacterized protein (TIGR02246 family) n=1 Tax=Prauserella shujinwangii TaxID=1453103 RepID=A0A2T0LX90_9PSEU|nr:SgcJ/EcaC family oxidoreductase [Prauserella shujinwangii]PRX48643.1 uncharacterized protein (TIGR02246 family) [Prauserella shujinwangii]
MTETSTVAPVVGDTAAGHDADIAAIERIIADTERAFNTNDAELLTAHFARNASVVNAAGMRTTGRDELLRVSREGLAGPLRDQYARYELLDVLFVRPDVALAHKGARAITADGEPLDVEHAMLALYVLVKERDRWWVVARQNTIVPG